MKDLEKLIKKMIDFKKEQIESGDSLVIELTDKQLIANLEIEIRICKSELSDLLALQKIIDSKGFKL